MTPRSLPPADVGEALFRAVFDGALDAMLLADDRGRYLDANPAACELFGLSREELLGRSAHDFVDADFDVGRAWSAFADDGRQRGLFPLRRPDGGRRVLEYAATAGVLPGVHLSVLRDVTEAERARAALASSALALRESEHRYRQLVERSPEPILVHAEGRIVFANDAAITTLGAAERGLIGRSITDLAGDDATHEAIRARGLGSDARADGGALPICEQRFRRDDDGRMVIAEVSTGPIVFDGRPAAMSVARDVTGRRAAEDAAASAMREKDRALAELEFERQRLGRLLQHAPETLAVFRGPDRVIEIANDAFVAACGGREVVGRSLLDALPELRGHALVGRIDGVMRSGTPYVAQGEVVPIVNGGQIVERVFNYVYQPIVEADGTVSRVFALGTDVTDQAHAARALRAQFLAVPIPVFAWKVVVDGEGTRDLELVDHNDAAVTLTAGGVAQRLGQRASEVLGATPRMLADLWTSLDEQRIVRSDGDVFFAARGETRTVTTTFAPVPPDRVLGFVEDVTERRRLEEQLCQAQKMDALGRLAGGVAHDFNNMLAVVLSYASFLHDAIPEGDPRRDDVEEIQRAAERSRDLTAQLLAFSRRQPRAAQPMIVAEAVAALERMLKPLLRDRVALRLRCTGTGTVLADPGQLGQVVMNLAVNARDAMPDGGTVSVDVEDVLVSEADARVHGLEPGPHVSIRVTDTGVGIDPAIRARLFEPFFTTKPPGQGTGLGLPMVFGIVKQAHGAIAVRSELGHGATFEVLLPCVPVSASGAA